MGRGQKKSSCSSQLTAVEAEVIKIGRRILQLFLNGCFSKDPDRGVVEVQSRQMHGNLMSHGYPLSICTPRVPGDAGRRSLTILRK